jgi:hypothetical protein
LHQHGRALWALVSAAILAKVNGRDGEVSLRFCCVALTANSAFNNSDALDSVAHAVVETLRSPLLVGKPRSNVHLGRGFFYGSGETTLMPIDPGECRQHALDCVRLAQTATTHEAKKDVVRPRQNVA